MRAMVNPGKVLKARKSKRQPLKLKHKIERKVREHQRKQRRDEKRNPNKHRKKKDPGIPNSWPFKQELLQEQERRRAAEADARIAEKERRKQQRAEQRKAEAQLQAAVQESARDRRAAKRRAAAFAPLQTVLAEADVVLLVLDARDPAACRCAALEQALLECRKLPLLVLNKSDLVPPAVLRHQLTALRAELPVIPLSAAAPAAAPAAARPSAASAPAAAAAPNAEPAAATVTLEISTGLAALRSVLDRYAASRRDEGETTVGVVGFDSAGKRSLIKLASAASWSGVRWLPLPARLQPLSASVGVNDVLLRKCAPALITQPELLVGQVLERCDRRALLRHFKTSDFVDEAEFLRALGGRQERRQRHQHYRQYCYSRAPSSYAPSAALAGEAAALPTL